MFLNDPPCFGKLFKNSKKTFKSNGRLIVRRTSVINNIGKMKTVMTLREKIVNNTEYDSKNKKKLCCSTGTIDVFNLDENNKVITSERVCEIIISSDSSFGNKPN